MATTARRISGNEFTPDDIIEVSVDYPGIMYVCEQRIEVVSGPDVTHGGAVASTDIFIIKTQKLMLMKMVTLIIILLQCRSNRLQKALLLSKW